MHVSRQKIAMRYELLALNSLMSLGEITGKSSLRQSPGNGRRRPLLSLSGSLWQAKAVLRQFRPGRGPFRIMILNQFRSTLQIIGFSQPEGHCHGHGDKTAELAASESNSSNVPLASCHSSLYVPNSAAILQCCHKSHSLSLQYHHDYHETSNSARARCRAGWSGFEKGILFHYRDVIL